ncbi:MAG TPA: helix-turn-helix domain-containing protein [Gemmatimonadales bacterium]|nr:helix-turn-helix domain-containing protein [Gemmatimonadales bacterium]
MKAPGLGESQRAILDMLKRRGQATIPQLAAELGLNIETVRDHLKTLTAHALVRREGSLKGRPGRPEIMYGLAPEAESLFPRHEGKILHELAAYLKETGNERILRDFFKRRIGSRRKDALAMVEHLSGRERLEAVARIFSELGFMATVEEQAEGPQLRLCHCPLRELVDATKIPCAAEIGFLAELLGARLARQSYIPAGGACCSYQVGG